MVTIQDVDHWFHLDLTADQETDGIQHKFIEILIINLGLYLEL